MSKRVFSDSGSSPDASSEDDRPLMETPRTGRQITRESTIVRPDMTTNAPVPRSVKEAEPIAESFRRKRLNNPSEPQESNRSSAKSSKIVVLKSSARNLQFKNEQSIFNDAPSEHMVVDLTSSTTKIADWSPDSEMKSPAVKSRQSDTTSTLEDCAPMHGTSNIPMAARVMQEIAQLGLHLADPDMFWPEVGVLGPQSSGKSALMSDLTDLKYPVGDGTTTRFPTAVTKVSGVSERVDAYLQEKQGSKCKLRRPDLYDSFRRKWSRNLSRGEDLPLEDIIQAASNIILDIDANFSDCELRIVHTSPKNLAIARTFIDLPGLFSSGPDANFVSSMCKYYLGRPTCLIYNVVQASIDLECSQGFALVKELDPSEKRTYTVATKIDQSHNKWVEERLNGQCDVKESSDGPLCFFVRGRARHEAAFSDQAMQSVREELFRKKPWSQSPKYAGIKCLQAFTADWILHHCGPVSRIAKRKYIDYCEDTRDSLAELPPPTVEREPTEVAREKLRETLQEVCAGINHQYQEISLQDVIQSHASKRETRALTTIVRDLRNAADRIVTEVFKSYPYLQLAETYFLQDLEDDFARWLEDVKIDLHLSTSSAVMLGHNEKLILALPEKLEALIRQPFARKVDIVYRETIMGNENLVLSLSPPIDIENEVEVRRKELVELIGKYEKANALFKQLRS